MTPAIVSDAGPIHYLILIGQIDLLRDLFGKVVIPKAVRDELSHPRTPKEVRAWLQNSPDWLEVSSLAMAPSAIRGLGLGETAALQLAAQLDSKVILLDDFSARKAARFLNFTPIGTLSILEDAAAKGLIKFPEAVAKLRATSFYITESLITEALERDRFRQTPVKDSTGVKS